MFALHTGAALAIIGGLYGWSNGVSELWKANQIDYRKWQWSLYLGRY
jgi:hypothetical protein